MFCRNCGYKQPKNFAFCSRCGSPQNSGSFGRNSKNTLPARKPKSKLKSALLSFIVTVLLFAVSAFGLHMVLTDGLEGWFIGVRDDAIQGSHVFQAGRQNHVPVTTRLINIHNIEGDDVTLTREPGGRGVTPRSGQSVHSGNVLNTGRNSFVYMQLDGMSLAKMDEVSRVSVSTVGNVLALNVHQGELFVEIEQAKPEHRLEVLIGNTTFSVRGTIFIIGYRQVGFANAVFVTMLSGEGAMRIPGVGYEVIVVAGQSLLVLLEEQDPEERYEIRNLDINDMSLFELREIYNRRSFLIDAGVLTRQQVLLMPAQMNYREAVRADAWARNDALVGVMPSPVPFINPTPAATPGGVLPLPANLMAAHVALYEILRGYVDRYGFFDGDWSSFGVRYASLVDFDKDGIPELLVATNELKWGFHDARLFVYGFVNGRVVRHMDVWMGGGTGSLHSHVSTDGAGNNLLVLSHGGMGESASYYHTISNGKVVRIAAFNRCTNDIPRGFHLDLNEVILGSDSLFDNLYRTEVSEEEFNAAYQRLNIVYRGANFRFIYSIEAVKSMLALLNPQSVLVQHPIPTPTPPAGLPTPTPVGAAATPPQVSSVVSVGETIQFGNHVWRVLDVQGYRALIITVNIIGHRWYHNERTNVTWETSEIRQYLNTTFLNTFSESDKKRIIETTIFNSNNQWFDVSGGNDTNDHVFLLAIEEVVMFFGDSGHLAYEKGVGGAYGAWGISDVYNNVRIARTSGGTVSSWWLRSPGSRYNLAASVNFEGILWLSGWHVKWYEGVGLGIRPALWLNLRP